MNLARYLLERREAIDPDWRAACGALLDFVRATFTHEECGLIVCHEQDEDRPKDQSWLFQPELRARGDFVRQCERSYLTTLSTSDRAEDQVNEMLYPA